MPYFKSMAYLFLILCFYRGFDDNDPLVNFLYVLVNILLAYVNTEGIFVSLFEVAILVFRQDEMSVGGRPAFSFFRRELGRIGANEANLYMRLNANHGKDNR